MRESFTLKTALFVVVYVIVAQLGMMLAIPPGNVTPVYPAAGLAWAMALIFGNRALLGVFLGGFLANWMPIFSNDTLGMGFLAAFSVGCGEVLAVFVANVFFRKLYLEDQRLSSTKSIAIFSFIGIFWLVSPTVGVSALYFTGFIDADAYVKVWTTWWLGDSIGVLLATPAILLVLPLKGETVAPLNFNVGNVAIIFGIIVGSIFIFANIYPVLYLLTLALLLAAFRLTQLELVAANIMTAVIAIHAMLSEQGPTANFEPEPSLLMLQLWIAVNIISSLLISSNIRSIRLLGVNLTHEKFIAREDTLTGVLNRRGFEELVAIHMRQQSNEKSTHFVMFDIDNFKKVNDTYGHPIGDRLLRALTRGVSTCIRKQDVFGRVGGEEFALLLLDSTTEQAVALSERIRECVAELEFPLTPQGTPKITISIGVTKLANAEQLHQTFDRVDKLLYQAKKEGKNCVVMG